MSPTSARVPLVGALTRRVIGRAARRHLRVRVPGRACCRRSPRRLEVIDCGVDTDALPAGAAADGRGAALPDRGRPDRAQEPWAADAGVRAARRGHADRGRHRPAGGRAAGGGAAAGARSWAGSRRRRCRSSTTTATSTASRAWSSRRARRCWRRWPAAGRWWRRGWAARPSTSPTPAACWSTRSTSRSIAEGMRRAAELPVPCPAAAEVAERHSIASSAERIERLLAEVSSPGDG